MIISALVLTLDAREAPVVMRELRTDGRLTLGEAHGLRLPVVAETETLAEGEALFDALTRLDGVRFVDVVRVDFESDEEHH